MKNCKEVTDTCELSIIEKMAEKHGLDETRTRMIRETAERMAVSLILFGSDNIEKEWKTATEQYTCLFHAESMGYMRGRKELNETIERFEADIDVVRKERDAAIAELEGVCSYCKHDFEEDCYAPVCGTCSKWEWRGEPEHEI